MCIAFMFHCIAMIWRKSKDTKKALIIKRRKKSLMPLNEPAIAEFNSRVNTTYPTGNINEKPSSGLKSKVFQTITHNQNSHTLDFIIIFVLIMMFSVYLCIYAVIYK